MIIIGHQRGNVIGLDLSGHHHARIICSPLVAGLAPPTQPRKPVVIPPYPVAGKQYNAMHITSIKDHWPARMDTRAYHDDMERRKKETTEKLRLEVNHNQQKEA